MLVLVVGRSDSRGAVAAALAPHGLDVALVATAAEAHERQRGQACPLIMLDWSLANAATICRTIADCLDVPEPQLIALSAERDVDRLAAMFAAGAHDVLTLPADGARLAARALDLQRRAPGGVHPRLYQLALERNPVALCLLDDKTLQFLSVSDGAVKQYGWSREEFARMNLREIRPSEMESSLDDDIARSGPSLVTAGPHLRKDGSTFIGQGMLTQIAVGEQHIRFAVSRDVTAETRTAEAHRRSLTAYQQLVEGSADGVFTHRLDSTLTYVNPAFVAFLGYASASELVERSVLELVRADDRPGLQAAICGLGETAQPTRPRPTPFIGKDGEVRWAETRSMLVVQGEERVVTVIARDLTERRQAEEALRRSEERFSSIFENSPAAICITRLSDSRFVVINERFEHLTGFSRADVVGKTGIELGLWQDPSARAALYAAVAATGRVRDVDVQVTCKNGQRADVLLSAVRVDVAGEPCVLALGIDISERKRLDEELRHARKMEAIGRLAGGIAHDFNNLLTAIRGYSEVLLEQLPAGTSMHTAARHIQHSSLRAAGVTGQLLAFTRRQTLQPRVLMLDDTVGQMGALLRRIIGGDVTLTLALGAPLCCVRVDPTNLEQVILNLAVNARDAMPHGGHVVIATEAIDDANGTRWVRLEVRDDGAGMDEQVRTRIFEPFFTTKEVGRGTGLGLSIVYGIVEQSGGTIAVDSAPGRGASFQIALPRVETAVAAAVAPDAGVAPRPGRGVIMVVEDEDDVHDFVQFILKRAGYDVLEANDGARALEIATRRDDIELLLTDVVMPQLNGHQLADSLRRIRPRVKVLFMSGYPGSRAHERPTTTPFLQKPFSLEELLQRVRDVLEKPAAD